VDVTNTNSLGWPARSASARATTHNCVRCAHVSQPFLKTFPLQTTAAVYLRQERNPPTELTQAFDLDRVGASVQQERQLANQYVWNYGVRWEQARTIDPRPGRLRDERTTVMPFTSTFTRETRDDVLDASRGSFASQAVSYAPRWLGADAAYLRYYGQYFAYLPLRPPTREPLTNEILRPRLVWANGVRLGLARGLGGAVPFGERFFGGGSTSVRGFAQNGLGPRDASGIPTGGAATLIVNSELRFPLVSLLDGVGFVDLGAVVPSVSDWRLADLRKSAGVGCDCGRHGSSCVVTTGSCSIAAPVKPAAASSSASARRSDPMSTTPLPWRDLGRRTWREMADDDVMGLAAQLSYYFFLALFPAILFLLALASFFPLANITDDIGRSLGPFVSPQVLGLIQDQMRQLADQDSGGLLTFGVAGALWSSSAAIVSIIGARNRAYDVEEGRPWWKVRLTAIGLTLTVATTVLVALSRARRSDSGRHVGPRHGWGAAFEWTGWCCNGLVFALVTTAIGLLYHFGPDADGPGSGSARSGCRDPAGLIVSRLQGTWRTSRTTRARGAVGPSSSSCCGSTSPVSRSWPARSSTARSHGLLHHRSKLGKVGADDLAQLLEALEVTRSVPRPVQRRHVHAPEPDERVLRRRLRLRPVVVVRIHRHIDAVRPVFQRREDIRGLGEPWHLGLFDERDVIRGLAEQPLVVRQQSGARRDWTAIDLTLQELAPGDVPERQGAGPREPPHRRAVDEVELLNALGRGLGQRDPVLS
jgi:YihY family inner membrane protein